MSDLLSGDWTDAQIEEMARSLLEVATPEEVVGVYHELRQEEMSVSNRRTPFQERYWNDPVAFAHDCLRWGPNEGLAEYQAEILAALPAKKRVCVRGPRGLGKSFIASVMLHWMALTRDAATDWKIGSTASVGRQLKDYLWPEIRKTARRIRWDRVGRTPYDAKTEMLLERLTLTTGHAYAATATDPASMEGGHASSIAMIFDEAKSIDKAFFDALEGCFSTSKEAYALVISTPGRPEGRFYEIQNRKEGYEDWHVIHVTLDRALAAGRIEPEWVESRRRQWGEMSYLFQAHVLGEFCAQQEDGVIPPDWVEVAQSRWRQVDAQ